jgi:predicted negative regulator of RcsB-dependent stress response
VIPKEEPPVEPAVTDEAKPAVPEVVEEEAVLPDFDESELVSDATPEPAPATTEPEPPPTDELTWDVEEGESAELEAEATLPPSTLEEVSPSTAPEVEPEIPERDIEPEALSWDEEAAREIDASDIKEGMPFKEVEPPVITDAPDEVMDHLFPHEPDVMTREAVTHLFPTGRGETSKDFIDSVVGTPAKISVTVPMRELESPNCPSCGFALTGDEFEYPPYVYDAMGSARMEFGMARIKENEHEEAIESFEKAKLIFEKSGNEKATHDAERMIDQGYDTMAQSHFDQGEQHLKESEFEWAIVQFRKAREIFMFTPEKKKRAKCSEKVRECYSAWGKLVEAEGDGLAKSGQSREALTKYQEAAEKYREGEDSKRLRGLEKKIRKA